MIIIPIGLQCTNIMFKRKIDRGGYTLPFDWMLSTPKFVSQMLQLLLQDNMDIKELVEKHFFLCEKRAGVNVIEHYYASENGFASYNTKYDVVFPHDEYNQANIDKYIRRFIRLKDIIMNSTEELCFIYTSQSSLNIGNFTINGKHVVIDVYEHLTKIYELIRKYRDNFKMVVFDAIRNEDPKLLHKDIILQSLNPCNSLFEMIPQMENHKCIFN